MSQIKILIYGYGNPGRQDDGLGNEFIEQIQSWAKNDENTAYEFDSNYQLNIEEAELISTKDLIIFVDASIEKEVETYKLTKVSNSSDITFTTHHASPGYILQLCNSIFDKQPPTYLLHIKGFEWDFKVGLSAKAKTNLEKALLFMKKKLKKPNTLIQQF